MWFGRVLALLAQRLGRRGRATGDEPEVSSELAAIITVIGEDRDLQAWFRQIATAPDNVRVSTVGRLVTEMMANDENEKTVEAFRSLGDASTCRAVAQLLRERYGVEV